MNYKKNDKRRMYWLIDEYLAGRIDEPTFCDEFYYSFGLEIEKEDHTPKELEVFDGLNSVASRFSPFEEDHQFRQTGAGYAEIVLPGWRKSTPFPA